MKNYGFSLIHQFLNVIYKVKNKTQKIVGKPTLLRTLHLPNAFVHGTLLYSSNFMFYAVVYEHKTAILPFLWMGSLRIQLQENSGYT